MAGIAESTSSSLTSTSHTLTNAPLLSHHNNNSAAAVMAISTIEDDDDASPLSLFLDSVDPSSRHVFLQPPPTLSTGSLQLAKETLDVLAGQVGDQQAGRFKALMGKKRKREAGYDRNAVLKIRKVHVDGFETGQVWQQAKKIIGCALEESEQLLRELEEDGEVGVEGQEELAGEGEDGERKVKMVRFDEDGFEVDSEDEDDDDHGSASEEVDEGSEGDSEDSDGESEDVSDEEGLDVELSEEEDGDEVDGEEDDGDEEEDEEEEASEDFQEDPDGLNDGFFSLEKFNKQTQWFEAQDARADPNTDANSDDESVDWHTDPFSEPKPRNKGGLDDQEDDDESDVDMDGEDDFDKDKDAHPIGKSKKDKMEEMDEGEDEDEGDGDDLGLSEMEEMDLTANDIYYKDFFAPPPKKGKRGGKKRDVKFSEPPKPEESDFERAERDVRRDLFDDDSERDDSEDALSDVSAGNPKSRRSAHERRQAKIAEEIRKLESELVAKRAWTLSGEATAADRPVNSLLEEDLDFEHVGKPVPVITEEVSESIEALIKRRILAQEFDELIRRRPDTLGDPNGARRGLVDIQDTKGKQSLAEIYEEEHAKKANPDAYTSQSDEKLRKDEEEIKQMWKDISGKLDALSSWHYKPKPAAPTLTVVADVATVAMEDAQPTTAQGVSGGESRMAPQEIYAPGKETSERGEVVAKSGLPIAKQEMSREDKLRRRRREKERIRKAGGVDANKPMSRGTQARKETMSELKKGGVKVINRKGEVMGLDGKKVVEQTAVSSSSRFKL